MVLALAQPHEADRSDSNPCSHQPDEWALGPLPPRWPTRTAPKALVLYIIINAMMMQTLAWFLLGFLTWPFIIIAILIHAYVTFPIHEDTACRETDIVQPGDDVDLISKAQKTLGEKFQPRSHEVDVAASYFAIYREYSPGGVNSKPSGLERSSPAGSTTISTPSPSVYQSMYRSIFDRKPSTSPLDNKGAGKPQKRGGNVFYVVLRYIFWKKEICHADSN